MKINKLSAISVALITLFTSIGSGLFANSAEQIIIPFKRIGLQWETDLPEKVDLLKIWYTLDNGQSWEIYSETSNPSSPAPVKVSEDGVYGFYTQARDASGLEEAMPIPGTPPKIIAVIDTKKPALVIVSPNSAETYSNTQDLRIEWNSSDVNFGPKPISLYSSKDGGGTWNVIAKNIANTGTYIWKLPAESSQYYKVKIVATDLAGNESEDTSDSSFIVDGKPPVTQVTGPRESKSPIFDITYNASDVGGAGIAKLQLYYQKGDSKVWHLYGEDKDLKSPLRFDAKEGGKYGFKLVGTDLVGNSEPKPSASTRPDIWTLMDSVNPVVKLTSFRGVIKNAGAGTTREITWTATDTNLAPNPITIQLSNDDGKTWKIIKDDYANTGRYPWKVPSGNDYSNARIRVTAIDVLGNQGLDVSDSFAIDATPPSTKVSIVTWDDDQKNLSSKKIPLRMSIQSQPSQKSASELLRSATVALQNNNLALAESEGRKALKIDANSYLIHSFFGKLNYEKGSYDSAAKSYLKSISLNPNYQSSRISLGACYVNMAQTTNDQSKQVDYYKKAVVQYEASTDIAPEVWQEYYHLGYIYARLMKYDLAISALNKATKLSADNGDAFWFLGQVYQKTGKDDLALQNYREALKAYQPESAMARKAQDKIDSLSN